MDGYLLIDKPTGWTSHDVVAKIRSILRQAQSSKPKAESQDKKLSATSSQLSAHTPKVRVGHTGTLDPAATGLMILVLGKYTKRAEQFSRLDKTYVVQLTLGIASSTADSEGELTKTSDKRPDIDEINEVLNAFIGQNSQVPPAFSAIKVDGQRAYKLARAGKEVKIEPRQVTIYSIGNIEYKYPRLNFITEVSSGTYIRSLAVDIGQKLGTGAYMSALNRTKIANYMIEDAVGLEELNANIIQSELNH